MSESKRVKCDRCKKEFDSAVFCRPGSEIETVNIQKNKLTGEIVCRDCALDEYNRSLK